MNDSQGAAAKADGATTWVVLFRGVNVGGYRKLPMAELRTALTAAGFTAVKSYIQSGNVLVASRLDRDEIGARITHVIETGFGFSPEMSLLQVRALDAALRDAPFGEHTDPARAHLFFPLEGKAMAAIGDLQAGDGDASVLTAGTIAHYLLTPDGMSRSKLADVVSRRLKNTATARNLRTCTKLLDMANP